MAKIFKEYIQNIKGFHRNILLYLACLFIINIGFGAFQADFNLFILSLGMTPAFLGIVLSLAPFADMLASIPVGFLSEKIGFKRSLLLVNLSLAAAYLIQVISSNRYIIMAGSFLAGLALCGNFVIQLPFANQYEKEHRDQAYTMLTLVYYLGNSVGALLGGGLVSWATSLFADTSTAYQAILIFFSLVMFTGNIPLLFMKEDKPTESRSISLKPYFSGVEKDTVRFAIIELFIGFGVSFVAMFLNVIFVYHYGSTVEAFGLMSALLSIPVIILLFAGPAIARKMPVMKFILLTRFLSIFLTLGVVTTQKVFIGGATYLLFRSLFSVSMSLWFSFAVAKVKKRSRMATAAWLEITFQLGLGTAAIVGGKLVDANNYLMLGILSSISMAITFLLTWYFYGRADKQVPAEA